MAPLLAFRLVLLRRLCGGHDIHPFLQNQLAPKLELVEIELADHRGLPMLVPEKKVRTTAPELV